MITILLEKILAALTSLMQTFTSDLATIKAKLDGISRLIIRNILSGDSDTVEYNTDLEEKFCKLKITFLPIQSGTGDPSPTNVRPISGYTGIKVGNYSIDTSDITSIQLIEVDWTTEAGTVYGGDVDLIGGSGVKKFGVVDMGSLNWNYNSSNQCFYAPILDIYNRTSGTVNNALCEIYKAQNVWQANDLSNLHFMIRGDIKSIYIKDTDYTDKIAFTNAVNGKKFVYELESPVSIQFPPEEITTIKRTANLTETGISTNSSYTLTNINVDNIELCYFETVNNYFKNKEV